MALKVSASDGVKVYTVAGGKNIPSWLSDKKKKSLKKDEEYRRRVELIQDFDFPAACQKIKFSADGQYIFATGYHPPRVRVYDLSQLSMKFERHLDSEIVDFQILSEDYSKAVFLCADRSLNFHAKFGAYYKMRVPKFGRDLAYCPFTAELLVASSAPEIYRVNLSEGRFMSPLVTKSPAVNACGISPAHGMLACAGEDGGLECFDLRQRDSLGWLDAASAAGGRGQGLTALRFDDGGMHVAVGTSGGLVALFDLRSQRPLVVKDHMYDSRIVDIKFHAGGYGGVGDEGRQRVISADRNVIKIWDASTTGAGYTNIEPAEGCDINDIAVDKGTGLIVAACDASRIQAYFIPSLGPAPRWCSFLESLTEELEETANPTVYDDYRFITRTDLEKLGLTHLVGTPMLKAYMHGFFVDNRLYQKAKSVADPFAYETYRQKRIAQKMEEERKSRISLAKRLPKVNAAVAARILTASVGDDQQQLREDEQDDEIKKKKKRKDASLPSLLEDDRFKVMFEDPEFAIDERSAEYRALHPNVDGGTGGSGGGTANRESDLLLREHFEALEAEEEEEGGVSDDDDIDDDEDDNAYRMNKRQKTDKKLKQGEGLLDRQPKMYAAKDEGAAVAFREGRSLAAEKSMPLGVRLDGYGHGHGSEGLGAKKQWKGGNREMSYTPRGRGRGRGRGGGGDGGGRGGGRGSGGRGDRGGRGGGGRGRSGGRGRGGGGGGRGRGGRR